MHVVLAGASGLIGNALRAALRGDGHRVTTLVRRPPGAADEARWAPERHELDPEVLREVNAVVCLSGAGVGDHRWTDSYKEVMRSSRLDSVGTLASGMAGLSDGPRVLLSASAVGYYGDTGERVVDESAPRGDGFLAELCEEWEAATRPAQDADIRVAQLRTGLVLSSDGGLLKRLKLIVSLGAGGRLGSGRQYMPWISLADEIAAIGFLLHHEVSGPVNLTGPDPVRNAEFIATLAGLLHRPAIVPTPGFALRIVLGEFAQDTLTGQRAVPTTLLAAGFTHQHSDLNSALRWALGR
ncbi:MAG: TIGR01777 family oxidoreductase [Actinomycetota bacterium]|nr:TIGR01777 family oxidoreductase [Actinomycetota bacterium]